MTTVMNTRTTDQALTEFLDTLARRKWWIVAVIVLVVAGALVASELQVKKYTATAQVLAQNTVLPGQTQPTVTLGTAQLATYAELATTPSVVAAVRKMLGVTGKVPPVNVAVVGTTNLIAITATSTKARGAAQVANDYANAFIAYEQGITATQANKLVQSYTFAYNELSKQLKQAESKNNSSEEIAIDTQLALTAQALAEAQAAVSNPDSAISMASPASIPGSPSSPRPLRDALLGLILGILLGLALAVAIDYLDDRIKSATDVQKIASNLPILAAVPMIDAWQKRKDPLLVSISNPTSPVVESYWSLRTSLKFLSHNRATPVVLITSPAEGEGKTATIANLGVVFAKSGQRTVVVSCDLRRPRLGSFFEDSPRPGLMSVLLGEVALEDAVMPLHEVEDLWILDSGPLPPDPHRALADAATERVFAELALNFDIVLIDSPPLLPVADALVLGQLADLTLVLVSQGQTRKRQLRSAIEMLETAHVPVAGLVINEVTRQSSYGYGYGYYSYGDSSYRQQDSPKKAAHKKERSVNAQRPSSDSDTYEQEPTPADGLEVDSQVTEERLRWRSLAGQTDHPS